MIRSRFGSRTQAAVFVAFALAMAVGSPSALADPALDEYTLDIPKADGEMKFDGSRAGESSPENGGSSGSEQAVPADVAEQLGSSTAGESLREIAENPAFGAPATGSAAGGEVESSGSGPADAASLSTGNRGLIDATASAGTSPAALALIVGVLCVMALLAGAAIRRTRSASP